VEDMTTANEMLDMFQANAWADEPASFFEARGLEHSTVQRFGLGYTGDRGRTAQGDVRHSLVIPYEDGLGNLRYIRFRPLRPGYKGPKYVTATDQKAHLFAVRALDNDTVHVAEGEIDAMILWQVGLKAVAVPGAQTFRPAWRHLFRQPHVRRAVLVLDPDKAGMSAAKRLYDQLSDVCDTHAVSLPKGMDVNDVFLRYGAETLRKAVA